MWTTESYFVDISAEPKIGLVDRVERIFNAAWRFDFTSPGFCLLDLGPDVDSHDLRSLMLDLKEQLGAIAGRRGVPGFVYRSLVRFDQQVTTRFHLDGAPDQSLLVLAYEPSTVRSRLSLADYSRCAHDLGMPPERFLDEFNPMFRKGETLLAPYVTELPGPDPRHSRILLINNSRLPYTEARANPLGVLHKAEILTPDDSERRIVNSMMLSPGGPEEIDGEAQRAFVAADDEVGKPSCG